MKSSAAAVGGARVGKRPPRSTPVMRHRPSTIESRTLRVEVARDPVADALSVAIADVDHRERRNDAHGHGCGIRALALVEEGV
jgi:hypothetical protein